MKVLNSRKIQKMQNRESSSIFRSELFLDVLFLDVYKDFTVLSVII